jgi:hypothetical protein
MGVQFCEEEKAACSITGQWNPWGCCLFRHQTRNVEVLNNPGTHSADESFSALPAHMPEAGVCMTKVAVKKENGRIDRCHRCGGLMIPEKVFEIGSIDWHCLSCGERVDSVILAHRRKDEIRGNTEQLLAGKGKARLN